MAGHTFPVPRGVPEAGPLRVLGFMTGTSLDAVDIAELTTDGTSILSFGPSGEYPLRESTRSVLLDAIASAREWPRGEDPPAVFARAAAAVAEEHFHAATAFLVEQGLRWSHYHCIGVHGQTVLHERPAPGRLGRTVQLLDAPLLARLCGIPVVHDFRSADVSAGGEGAPLAPVYHAALARFSRLPLPAAVLNVGGVANVTFISPADNSFSTLLIDRTANDPAALCLSSDDLLVAFDTGPGNGLLDSLVTLHGLGRCDEGGMLAAAGRVDDGVVDELLSSPYFSAPPPKSLDRYTFTLGATVGLSPADAAATLVAFTARAVARAFEHAPGRPGQQDAVQTLVVCGGGRRNPVLMTALTEVMGAAPLCVRVVPAESVGWRGDSVEAEAFAFLAARVLRGLPLSFSRTTGVSAPTLGGRVCYPSGSLASSESRTGPPDSPIPPE
jgi:anhydro-N-acetylmuramic acid kinase